MPGDALHRATLIRRLDVLLIATNRARDDGETVTLERVEALVPDELPLVGETIVPWHAGQTLGWKFVG